MTPGDARRCRARPGCSNLSSRVPTVAVHCPSCSRLCKIVCLTNAEERAADVGTVDRATAAPLGPRADRPLRDHREARRGGDGTGVPRPLHHRAAGRGEDDPGRAGRGAGLPGPVRPRGGGRQPGQRRVHRVGHPGRRGGRPALGGHRVRARAVAEHAGAPVRPAAGAGGALARGRLRGGAAVDSQRRAGAPRRQAVERAGGAGRPAGDRLRGGPGGRAGSAHRHPRRGRDPRLHGARAGQGRHLDLARERRVLARGDAGVRRDRSSALPGRHRDGHPGPARDRGARPDRDARGAGRPCRRVPASGCRATARPTPRS